MKKGVLVFCLSALSIGIIYDLYAIFTLKFSKAYWIILFLYLIAICIKYFLAPTVYKNYKKDH